MPALLTILCLFALILLLMRLRVPLAAALLLGGAGVGLRFGLSAPEVLRAFGAGAIDPQTIGLVVITACLLALSAAMQAGEQMKRIVSLAQALLRRPVVTVAALPALIGLLPMPGGALFSAPMVASAAAGRQMSPAKLSAINYWFRHIWEHWWPLYPGVLLAMTLTGMTLGRLIAFQLPMGLYMTAAGMLILRKSHPDLHVTAPRPPRGTKRKLLRATSSIWLIIAVWLCVTLAARFLPTERIHEAVRDDLLRYGPITLGLIVSLIWTARFNRLDTAALRKVALDKRIYSMTFLVLSVMIFQHLLKRVGVAGMIADELTSTGVAVVLVAAMLPFVAGLVTGVASGFVATSFPIVLGLLEAAGEPIAPYLVLAYAFGHLGMMLSPLHLCQIVSNRYFKTTYAPVYRQMLPSAALLAVLAVAYFVALKYLMS